MKETYVKWEPVEGLSDKYYIDAVLDLIDGFTIELSSVHDRKKKVRVVFERSVGASRRTSKVFFVSMMSNIHQQYGEDFFNTWTFFKVINSEYLRWLSEESLGISNDWSLQQFSFVCSDSMLDIAADYEPKIQFVD